MRMNISNLAHRKTIPWTAIRPLVLLLPLIPALAFAQSRNPSVERHTLHTVHEIFALTLAQASLANPVDLNLEVTYSDPGWGLLFVQDRTGPTFIDVHGSNIAYPLGTRIHVKAVTGENNNGITIVHPTILVVGHGSLPNPVIRSVAELDAGVGESHRVVTEGVLHSCEIDWHRVCFQLYDGNKRLWVSMHQPDGPAAQSLIGATVLLTGVAGSHENDDNIRVGAEVFVSSLDDIKVKSPPISVSFSSSPTSIGELRASRADERFATQVHVRGTVTWQSQSLFSIRDNTGTLLIGPANSTRVRAGTAVDAIGFPSHGVYGLELADSAVRLAAVQTGAATTVPLRISAVDLVKHSSHGIIVQVKARLIAQSATGTELVY